jgi:hypothetical protein
MNNPLFNAMNNNPMNMNALQRFNQFKQMFKGDARQQIQQMMNSGQITQEQYNRAVQMANEYMKMFK